MPHVLIAILLSLAFRENDIHVADNEREDFPFCVCACSVYVWSADKIYPYLQGRIMKHKMNLIDRLRTRQ